MHFLQEIFEAELPLIYVLGGIAINYFMSPKVAITERALTTLFLVNLIFSEGMSSSTLETVWMKCRCCTLTSPVSLYLLALLHRRRNEILLYTRTSDLKTCL